MSEHRAKLSRLAFGSYSNCTPLFKLSREVELCCNYLCLVENETDTTKCSRWFREQGSMEERKKLIDMGITRYLQTTKVVNSVTIANYIKSLLREIPGGLISSNMQELLTDLLRKQDGRLYLLDIDGLEIEAARAILAQIPFGIMSNLLKLCSFIFEKGKVDPLSPQALARIVTVTSEDRLHKIDPKDQKEIQKLLNDWHTVWGYIISHENLFT